MPEQTFVAPGLPGIGLRYTPELNPYFKVIASEALHRLKRLPTGAKLLDLIANSRPEINGVTDPDWPSSYGVRVLIVPTRERTMLQDGYRRMFSNLVPTTPGGNRPFNPTPLSGSCNCAIDQDFASNNKGSIARIYFNNTIMKTSKGELSYPFIVLGHELIHAYHTLAGIKKDGKEEELWTTGIGKYASEPVCENALRREANLPLRTSYY